MMDFYSEIQKAGKIAAIGFHGNLLESAEKINKLFYLSESAASQSWDGESKFLSTDVLSKFIFNILNVKFSVNMLFCRVNGTYADTPSLVKIDMCKNEE